MRLRITTNERGAALLFAMGLLALFLLLAMAFAANSLLQRKIAANRSSRTMVEVIAESAVDQVRAAMIYYQRSGVTLNDTMDINALSIQHGTTDDYVNRELLEVEKLYGKVVRFADFSGCIYKNDPTHDISACTVCEAWLNNKRPYWQYVKNDQAATQKEIVGRYSYIMIPPGPRYQDFSRNDPVNAANPILRWNSTEEYIAKVLKGKTGSISYHGLTLNAEDLSVLLARELEVYEPFNLDAYVSYDTSLAARAIPPRPMPLDFYHRFNLSRANWSITPEILLDTDPVRFFKEGTGGKLIYTNGKPEWNDPTTGSTEVNGIQYLRRIGDTEATFANIGNRRLQIAANLIDYCDGDDVPTASHKPDTWDGSTNNTVTYAGNEATPYIDRLGAVIRFALSNYTAMTLPVYNDSTFLTPNEKLLYDHMIAIDTTSTQFRDHALYALNLEASMLAGLVRVYPNNLSANYALQLFMEGDGLRLKAKLNGGGFSFAYQYEEKDSEGKITIKDATGSVTFPDATAKVYFKQPFVTNETIRFGDAATANGENGKLIFRFKDTDFKNNGYATVKTDQISKGNSMVSMKDVAYVSTLPFIFNATEFINHLKDGTYVPNSFSVTGKLPISVVAEKAEILMDRMVLSDLAGNAWEDDTVQTSLTKTNVDYVNKFSVAYNLNDTAFTGTTPEALTFALGGIFCRDPRQNLFGADWYPKNKNEGDFAVGSYSATKALFGVDTGDIFGTSEFVPVPRCDTPYDDRNPQNTSGLLTRDFEVVSTPAWTGNAASQHLSTAFFRNEPMKSLAELGFIHRGAMWETLNLANAAKPVTPGTNVASPVEPADYLSSFDYTSDTLPGTSYQQGDGGLLDQVKVVDDTKNEKGTRVRDQINLNLRDGNGMLSSYFAGDVYYDSLLASVRLGALQVNSDVKFIEDNYEPSTNPGKDLSKLGIADVLIRHLNWQFNVTTGNTTTLPKPVEDNTPPLYANRAQLLWYNSPFSTTASRFYNGYGTMTSADVGSLTLNKGLQDELCAKVMEHSTAGILPTVYRVLVVAQSIRDIGADTDTKDDGFLIRIDTDGDGTAEEYTDVRLGKYDPGADEITGQLRMIVTFVRDPITFKVLIKDIEYIED